MHYLKTFYPNISIKQVSWKRKAGAFKCCKYIVTVLKLLHKVVFRLISKTVSK